MAELALTRSEEGYKTIHERLKILPREMVEGARSDKFRYVTPLIGEVFPPDIMSSIPLGCSL